MGSQERLLNLYHRGIRLAEIAKLKKRSLIHVVDDAGRQ